MPRKRRTKSFSNIYHVTLRGNGKQVLFERDSDRMNFLNIMQYSMKKWGCTFPCYCLMDNHVHLVVNTHGKSISGVIHDVAQVYAQYYNAQYYHSGHVFEGRFYSSSIECESYFWDVVCYVLYNPVRAGISESVDYRWSSYYTFEKDDGIADWDSVFQLAGGKNQFKKLLLENVTAREKNVHTSRKPRFSDEEVMRWLNERFLLMSGTELQGFAKEERDHILYELKKSGASIRQLSRITGLGLGIVQRARK